MLGREPALWLGALQALIALAVGFGLELSAEQVGLVMALAAALLSLALRRKVSPTAAAPRKAPRGGKREAG